MKTTIKRFGLIATAAIIALAFTACPDNGGGSGNTTHSHTWGEYTQTTAPTCTAAGIKTRVCTDCGETDTVTQEGDPIVPDAHNYEWLFNASTSIETETCTHNNSHTRDIRLKDSRDGKTYKIVKINNQTWMAENLNYAAEGSLWYDNLEANGDKYGRLYDWATAMDGASSSAANPSGVRGVAPTGWHLPSGAEWNALIGFVHSDNDPAPYYSYLSELACKYLKAETGWNSYSDIVNDDKYGFSALPGGRRSANSNFINVDYNGYWWSASEFNNSNADAMGMSYNYDGEDRTSLAKYYLLSVRCVMD
jgi:uncharacterized protein (TIGR02145 family)